MKQTDLNRRERNCMELLIITINEAIKSSDVLKERAKSANPYCYRFLKMSIGLLDKAITMLIGTISEKHKDQLKILCETGAAEVRRPAASVPPNYFPLSVSDANTIIGYAVNDTCKMCFKDRRECDACHLRKALLNVHPPLEYDSFSNCPYQNIQWADPDREPELDYM